MDTIKKTFRIMAGLSLLHVLAAGGLVGWLVQSGRLDAERVRQVVDLVMNGPEPDTPKAEDDQPERKAQPKTRSTVLTDRDRITADEIRWRNTDRYRTQLEQRLRFINLARVDLDRQRDQLKREREKFEAQKRRQQQLAESAGHQKELQIIKALKPGVALEQIMTMTDADAARLMYELDNRRVKKIFEAARSGDEKKKVTAVRKLIGDFKTAGTSEPAEQAS